MNADTIAQAIAEVDVIRGLLDEWISCLDDAPHYSHREGIERARGMSWTEWSELHREILDADLQIRGGRLAVLLGVPGVQHG